jgi:glycosyltransferase involved in cell wall biosynthesis
MLLCVLDHPTQYDPPLWRAFAKRGRMPIQVWYAEDRVPVDPELSASADWSSVHAHADGGVERVHVPSGALQRRLWCLTTRPRAIVVAGWRGLALQVLPYALFKRIPVIVLVDKTLNEPAPGGALGHAYTALQGLRARAFAGFFTPGLLGSAYLASLGFAATRIATGMYPVDIAFWQARMRSHAELSAALRARAPHGADTSFVLVAVCKLSERENPLTLLEAFASFARQRPDAFFIQVGDGPLRAAFEAKVRELAIERQVHLAGYVNYGELAGYYGAADVFAHVPAREPWGLSVLEAMACGLPVLAATSVGAAADLVQHGRTGALAYAGDRASIARGLELIGTREQARSLGEQAAQAVARFDVACAAQALEELVFRLENAATETPSGKTKGKTKSNDDDARSYARMLYSDLRNEFGKWSE